MSSRATATTTAEVADSIQNDGYFCEIPSDPCAIVMFGASGDLAKRKLLPALFDLAIHSCLAPRFRVIGFARTEMSDDKFRESTDQALPKKGDDSKRADFLKHLEYFTRKLRRAGVVQTAGPAAR